MGQKKRNRTVADLDQETTPDNISIYCLNKLIGNGQKSGGDALYAHFQKTKRQRREEIESKLIAAAEEKKKKPSCGTTATENKMAISLTPALAPDEFNDDDNNNDSVAQLPSSLDPAVLQWVQRQMQQIEGRLRAEMQAIYERGFRDGRSGSGSGMMMSTQAAVQDHDDASYDDGDGQGPRRTTTTRSLLNKAKVGVGYIA